MHCNNPSGWSLTAAFQAVAWPIGSSCRTKPGVRRGPQLVRDNAKLRRICNDPFVWRPHESSFLATNFAPEAFVPDRSAEIKLTEEHMLHDLSTPISRPASAIRRRRRFLIV